MVFEELTWTSLSDHHKWRGACRDNCENVIEFESHLRKTQKKNTQNKIFNTLNASLNTWFVNKTRRRNLQKSKNDSNIWLKMSYLVVRTNWLKKECKKYNNTFFLLLVACKSNWRNCIIQNKFKNNFMSRIIGKKNSQDYIRYEKKLFISKLT